MTRPIPVSSHRKRPSKSCVACRAAKAKCTGLTEDYLHALDDPAKPWTGPPQTCTRCTRTGAECEFAPSRRKGRPRRLARDGEDGKPHQQQPHAGGSGSSSGDSPRSPTSRRHSPSSSASTSTQTSLPTPPALTNCTQLPAPQLPIPPQVAHTGVPSITVLAARYGTTAHVWAPFLPHSFPVLYTYLSTSHPSLPHALACLLDPSLAPPPFVPVSLPAPAPLATIQTTLLLALHAFVVKDRARAIGLLQWACQELRATGWAGEATPQGVGGDQRELFMRTGWYAWGIEIHMGFIAGVRASILAHVPPPISLDPSTLQRHVLALAQQATDYSQLWALDAASRDAYITAVVARASLLYNSALAELSSPAPHPAAQRSSLFSAALISQTAIVLVLSSLSPLSPLIAPLLPCSLDTTSPPPPPGSWPRARITAAARAIISVVRAHVRTTGAPLGDAASSSASANATDRVHSPFFGCCLVVAARGALLAAEDALVAPPPRGDLAQLAADLDLCEEELRRQAAHWPATETLATEVGLLRRTAGVV